MKPLRLMIVCGEPSGDLLGAQLMASFRLGMPDTEIAYSGVGGDAMAAQGFSSLFPLTDTALMGLAEIVPKIPKVLRRIKETAAFAVREKPDAVILIDSPDFTQRVAKRIHAADPDIPLIAYVAPQVWATRPGRARKMAQYLSLVLTLLPFEPPYFEKHGLKAVFVGHPAVERAAKMTGGAGFRARYDIMQNAPLLALLPGSRGGEIERLLPVFENALINIKTQVPELAVFLPLVGHVADRVRAEVQAWPFDVHLIESEQDKFAGFAAANVALAASGTVTTELALSSTPTIVGYKVHPLTAFLARRMLHVPYVTLTNLIAGKEVMPEYLQENCTAENLSAGVLRLLRDPAAAAAQNNAQDKAMLALGLGGEKPSCRAARALIEFLKR